MYAAPCPLSTRGGPCGYHRRSKNVSLSTRPLQAAALWPRACSPLPTVPNPWPPPFLSFRDVIEIESYKCNLWGLALVLSTIPGDPHPEASLCTPWSDRWWRICSADPFRGIDSLSCGAGLSRPTRGPLPASKALLCTQPGLTCISPEAGRDVGRTSAVPVSRVRWVGPAVVGTALAGPGQSQPLRACSVSRGWGGWVGGEPQRKG